MRQCRRGVACPARGEAQTSKKGWGWGASHRARRSHEGRGPPAECVVCAACSSRRRKKQGEWECGRAGPCRRRASGATSLTEVGWRLEPRVRRSRRRATGRPPASRARSSRPDQGEAKPSPSGPCREWFGGGEQPSRSGRGRQADMARRKTRRSCPGRGPPAECAECGAGVDGVAQPTGGRPTESERPLSRVGRFVVDLPLRRGRAEHLGTPPCRVKRLRL
jgi:hypothetical protein